MFWKKKVVAPKIEHVSQLAGSMADPLLVSQKRGAWIENNAGREKPEVRVSEQAECSHRKGGFVENTIQDTRLRFLHGDSHLYAVIKHRLPTGGVMVLCQRCGKEWHPFNIFTGDEATPGWQEAVNFITDNTTSGSSLFIPPLESLLDAKKELEELKRRAKPKKELLPDITALRARFEELKAEKKLKPSPQTVDVEAVWDQMKATTGWKENTPLIYPLAPKKKPRKKKSKK